jgi:hypothetical protein
VLSSGEPARERPRGIEHGVDSGAGGDRVRRAPVRLPQQRGGGLGVAGVELCPAEREQQLRAELRWRGSASARSSSTAAVSGAPRATRPQDLGGATVRRGALEGRQR